MDYTSRYRLAKPSYDDDVDIQVINANMDIIDGALNVGDYLPLTGGTVTGTTKFKDITSLDGADELNISCNGGELSITKNGTYFNDSRLIGVVSQETTTGTLPNYNNTLTCNYSCTAIKYDNGILILLYDIYKDTDKITQTLNYVTLNYPIPFVDNKYSIGANSQYEYDTTQWLHGDYVEQTSTKTPTSIRTYITQYENNTLIIMGRWK